MTISRVKPGNWAVNDKLTSAEMNAVDTNTAKALDRTSAGDTLEGAVTCSGAGRIRPTVVTGADANTTYQPGGGNQVIRVPSTLTANRTYTLGTTGVGDGDWIEIYCDPALTYTVTVTDGSTTLAQLSGAASNSASSATPATNVAARFVRRAGAWELELGGRAGLRAAVFLANGTFTVPPGVYRIHLIGHGGGGGGAGGDATGGGSVVGGGGGGAALLGHAVVEVTPGASATVAIGSGGTGGSAGVGGAGGAGGTGGSTTFTIGGVTYTFPGASGGSVPAGGSFGGLFVGGTGGAAQTAGTAGSSLMPGSPGSGGAGGSSAVAPATGGGGGGGAAGVGGSGGAGGAAGSASNGTAGVAAAANSGAGGGGGGGGGSFSYSGGVGGAGGSGKLVIIWS